MKILALIPARGGSKGLPRKNTLPLNGLPLIVYSINAGLGSQYIDTVWVSSDDDQIIEIARKYGANVLKRPVELADDSASIHDVIAHAIDYIRCYDNYYDVVILLQPTSPLRNTTHIDEAFGYWFSSDASSLISVYRPQRSPFKCFVRDESGYLKGLVNDEAPFMNRQELSDVYMPNGAIYIFGVAAFLAQKKIPVERIIPYIMDKKQSIDVDTQEDIDLIEKIIKQQNEGLENEKV